MRADIVLAFDQILEGHDIPTPEGLLKISEGAAFQELPEMPYSIATNLAHAVLWQDVWLQKLKGGPARPTMEVWKNDFRTPEKSELKALKSEFIEGLREGRRIAASTPMDHQLESDDEAANLLLRMIVHGAYHCGQLNLLKRAQRLATAKKPKPLSSDSSEARARLTP